MEKNWGALRCARWASLVCILVLVPTFLSPHFSLDPRLHARLLACLLLCLQGCAFEDGGGVDPEDLRADCGIQARRRHHRWVALGTAPCPGQDGLLRTHPACRSACPTARLACVHLM